jgi:hypothetical protein
MKNEEEIKKRIKTLEENKTAAIKDNAESILPGIITEYNSEIATLEWVLETLVVEEAS